MDICVVEEATIVYVALSPSGHFVDMQSAEQCWCGFKHVQSQTTAEKLLQLQMYF